MYVSSKPKSHGLECGRLLIISALIEFGRLVSSLYVNEIALHINHNIDDFKAPFSTKSLKSTDFVESQTLNTAYISMIRTIITAAQGLLDIFMGLSTSDMLALPPHIYAGRVIYAVILLMKLRNPLSASMEKLAQILSVETLRLETYIERLLLIWKQLNAEDGGSSLSRAFLIMPQLKEWLRGHLLNSNLGLNESSVERQSRIEHGAGLGATPGAELLQSLPAATNDQIRTSPGRSELGSDLGSQHEHPPTHDWNPEKEVETLNRELASDSWFWEFFNVGMLHPSGN